MSLWRTYDIRCNTCRRVANVPRSTSQAARAAARKKGWKRRPGSATSGADFCPACPAPDGAR